MPNEIENQQCQLVDETYFKLLLFLSRDLSPSLSFRCSISLSFHFEYIQSAKMLKEYSRPKLKWTHANGISAECVQSLILIYLLQRQASAWNEPKTKGTRQ